jgi:hypothetical protein
MWSRNCLAKLLPAQNQHEVVDHLQEFVDDLVVVISGWPSCLCQCFLETMDLFWNLSSNFKRINLTKFYMQYIFGHMNYLLRYVAVSSWYECQLVAIANRCEVWHWLAKLLLARNQFEVVDHLQKFIADLAVVIGRCPSCLWPSLLERSALFETPLIDSIYFPIEHVFSCLRMSA